VKEEKIFHLQIYNIFSVGFSSILKVAQLVPQREELELKKDKILCNLKKIKTI